MGKDTGGVTFATLDGEHKKKGSEKHGYAAEKLSAKLKKMKCFNCGEKGHIAKNCPHNEDKDESENETPMAGMALQGYRMTVPGSRLHEFYEVCIDKRSQVNIVDSWLLKNICTSCHTYRSMNRTAETHRVGYLDGFFDCMACDSCPTSILSMADVEDLYPVTYAQGKSSTVHMDSRDIVFVHKDKMYVADFCEWVVGGDDRVEELHAGLSLMTASDRESLYNAKQVRKALEAGEFLKALGYPTEREAVAIIRDGNVLNVPHMVEDVRRFYDIYGAQVPGIRGRTTKQHATPAVRADLESKEQITHQEMVMDVMHIVGQPFLISVSSPLELTIICYVSSLSKTDLGTGVQQHINTLRSRGFEPRAILVNPHKSLASLVGALPGTEIDPSGAGDHLDKVNTKIRRVKEIMWSIVTGLPFTLAKERFKNLVTYAVSRINLKSTLALTSNQCP